VPLKVQIANITDIRQNAGKIIANIIKTGEPTVILQRSKPVAYIVESSAYEDMLKQLETAKQLVLKAERASILTGMAALREQMARRGRQADSSALIRDLRGGKIR
jgi:PHD/YefM family antitoxin component YafN of YafNO toxin-antitoxin module